MPSAFLSTLSLRRATSRRALGFVDPDISIHALLAESDSMGRYEEPFRSHFYPRSPCGERRGTLSDTSDVTNISIHALLAESDLLSCFGRITNVLFLSTLSLRRATLGAWKSCDVRRNFYPRSPCGERHRDIANGERKKYISIHALLAESDRRKTTDMRQRRIFLSTLSLRRATQAAQSMEADTGISIHALLAESDQTSNIACSAK